MLTGASPFAGETATDSIGAVLHRVADLDFSSERERVLPEGPNLGTPSSSPDGRLLVLVEYLPGDAGTRIGAVDTSVPLAEREFIPIVTATELLHSPTLSPDGAWLAYSMRSAGQSRIVVRRFDQNDPGRPGSVNPVASERAFSLLWKSDGSALYYLGAPALRRVSFTVKNGEAVVGEPESVLAFGELSTPQGVPTEGFANLPDGRILFIERPVDSSQVIGHELVLNWFEELDRLVPPSK